MTGDLASESTGPDAVLPLSLRVSIIGTSNSIIADGYVKGLRDAGHIEIVANISLGASHSTAFVYLADDAILANSDYVIIDFALNEQKAEASGLFNRQLAREVFVYMLWRCQTQSAIPVILLLPMREREDGYEIAGFYKALCRDMGVLCFDAGQVAAGFAIQSRRNRRDMFRDGLHLRSEAAQYVGAALALALLNAHGATRTDYDVMFFPYSLCPVPPYVADVSVIRRKTSLISVSLARLAKGDEVILPIANGQAVAGIVLNMRRTNGNLLIEGVSRLIKRLNNDYFALNHGLWLVCWQILAPVVAEDRPIAVHCVADSNHLDVESHDHFTTGTPDLTDTYVEIAALVIRGAQPQALTWHGYREPDMTLGSHTSAIIRS